MIYSTGAYLRLSKEDGDKAESDSITNQRRLIDQFAADRPDFNIVDYYIDDDYTGTNFNRPGFKRMLADIDNGRINCVIVKDLSRFGRDYIDTGNYLERVFPQNGVRFIAINDLIDSARAQYDMLLPIKNIFNEQYSRDISRKVKSAFKSKQKSGEFVGAFAGYGFIKSSSDKHKLVIDPVAAAVVRRVFDLFESGVGKIRIAKTLNEESIPCPSEYKRMMGMKYRNNHRLNSTSYWTYSTVNNILKNEMYIGSMVQSRCVRQQMHGKARKLDKNDWVVVENTHDAIIGAAQWSRVQRLLAARGRDLELEQNISLFAGYLKCGDCGRAMAKTRSKAGEYYTCGSYKRYGAQMCTQHTIRHDELEKIILGDLNCVIAKVRDLAALADSCAKKQSRIDTNANQCEAKLERVHKLKQSLYEDYKDGVITKEDYLRFRRDYERQEDGLNSLIAENSRDLADSRWVDQLVEQGKLTSLDRLTVAELLDRICVFDDGRIEISYRFSAGIIDSADTK